METTAAAENESHKATILVADDSKVMLRAACKALETEFNVLQATNGQEAWNVLNANPHIDVVFSDLSMPVVDGYQLLTYIRNCDNPDIANKPVVIITGQEDNDGSKERVLEMGATDFISKPFNALDLRSRARSLSSYSNELNELQTRVIVDKLTKLQTETSFNDSGKKALSYAARHQRDLCVVRIDIDEFSSIFIKHGRNAVEQVLIAFAETLRNQLRIEDVAARLGVAQFALLLPATDRDNGLAVIERFRQSISEQSFGIGDDSISITLSIGYAAPIANAEMSFKQLMGKAENALEQAMDGGGNTLVFVGGEETAVQHEKTEQTTTTQSVAAPQPQKRGPRIDMSAVVREIDRGNGDNLNDKQINAAMNTVLPFLEFLNNRVSLGIDEAIKIMQSKVEK